VSLILIKFVFPDTKDYEDFKQRLIDTIYLYEYTFNIREYASKNTFPELQCNNNENYVILDLEGKRERTWFQYDKTKEWTLYYDAIEIYGSYLQGII
jgi:hypothetical protein